jgi:F420-dependent oxidoreductase-like protein
VIERDAANTPTAHFGVNVTTQHTSWEALREMALFVDDLGFDSLWTSDHFVALHGTAGPMLEAWQIMAGWGAITRNVRLGTLVSGNTYRHPAVVAKMVATLDHITGGRAILGLGAAWHEAEHAMYGLPFPTAAVRLSRLDEAARVIRRLLTEEVAEFDGVHYRLRGAHNEPKPLQRRLPLLIGGGGERRTLRAVAKHADLWHVNADPAVFGRKVRLLGQHCVEVARDLAEITPLVTDRPWICVRDRESDVGVWAREVARTNGVTDYSRELQHVTPDALVERLLAFWRAGARGFIFYTLAPFDRETVERIATDVRPRLLAAIQVASTPPTTITNRRLAP